MNIAIKNIREDNWRLIKAEAAKNNLKIGEFLNKMLLEYKKLHNGENNWNEVLYGKKFLTEKDEIKLREVMKELRKEFEFR